VLVGIQLFVLGLYLPPELKVKPSGPPPPQTTISVPVQTAVWLTRPEGALLVLVAVQLSIAGMYLPPVSRRQVAKKELHLAPPQTIISLPVQMAVCPVRLLGALLLPVLIQSSVLGLYLPPVFSLP